MIFMAVSAIAVKAQERVIRPGDTIDIVIYGHQELSRVVTVAADGTINFPFMQNIPVDGMPLEELRRFMAAQLSRYLDGTPMLTLSFADANIVMVSVLGHVNSPGMLQLPIGATLQESLAKAGGVLPGAMLDKITLIRKSDETITQQQYDLNRVILDGDLSQNPELESDDIILVTGNTIFAQVKVIGSVRSPGVFEHVSGATTLDMIFVAGGLSESANIKKIKHVSPTANQSREIDIDLEQYFKDPKSFELPTILPGDIIFVPQKNKFLSDILPIIGSLSSLLSLIYLVTRIQRGY